MGLNLTCVGNGLTCTPGSCGTFPIVKAEEKVFPLIVTSVSLEFRGAPYAGMNGANPMSAASIKFRATSAAGPGDPVDVTIVPFDNEDEETALTAVAQKVFDFLNTEHPELGYVAELSVPIVRDMDDGRKSAFVDIITVNGEPPVLVNYLVYEYVEDVSSLGEDERGWLGFGVCFNGELITPPYQLPGDYEPNGELNQSDAIKLLGNLFIGNPPDLPCEVGLLDAPGNLGLLDSNGSGKIDLSDAVYLLNYLYIGGPPPVLGTECYPLPGCPDNSQICFGGEG